MMEIDYNIIYDSAYNILDLRVGDYEYSWTVTLEDGLQIDFDTSGRPAAIEMIGASKKFQLLSRQLDGAGITGKIMISDDEIRLEMRVPERNRILESDAHNTYGIPSCVFEFEIDEYEM